MLYARAWALQMKVVVSLSRVADVLVGIGRQLDIWRGRRAAGRRVRLELRCARVQVCRLRGVIFAALRVGKRSELEETRYCVQQHAARNEAANARHTAFVHLTAHAR